MNENGIRFAQDTWMQRNSRLMRDWQATFEKVYLVIQLELARKEAREK